MASLADVGAELGKGSAVSLSELNSSDAETRVFGTYGYYRVNRFEITDGDAPAPSAGAVSLHDWDGYEQWDASRATGGSFDCTGDDWDSADFEWAQASGYSSFPAAAVRQRLLCVECATQSQAGCELEDFTTGTAYATTDGTTATASGLSHLTWYVCGVLMEWDDDGDGTYERVSNGYDAVSSPTEGFDNVDSIIFQTDNTTTTTPACTANGGSCSSCNTTINTGGGADCCSGWCDDTLTCVVGPVVFC